jgi:AcrR family transcriptional regulator
MELSKRQQQIVDAAIRIIADNGIQSLTTKRLAAEIGVTEPALYRHFKNKQEILQTIISYFKITMMPVLQKLRSSQPEAECIVTFVKEHFQLLESKPYLAKIIFAEPIFQNDAILKNSILTMMTESQTVLHDIIQNAAQNGKIRLDISAVNLTRLIVGSMRLLVTQWSMSGMMFNLNSEGSHLADDIYKMIRL